MTFAQFKTQYHLNLNPQQEEAVQALSGPVLLLAVPGSGKTTVLVSRIGYLIAQGVPPENILTMTYTVSAARDMSRRFAAFFGQPLADRLEFRTINGVCSRIIRAYERTQGRQAFQLLEDTGRQAAIIGEICRRQSGEFASESTVKAVQTAITYVKNSMISGEDLEQVEVEGVEFPPIYQEYCRLLRTHQLMDYDDQMIYAHRILKQFPQLLEQFRRRYPYLCVDEAQDTSKIQHAILRLLAGQNGNLFLVGDEDQSIYGFRVQDRSAQYCYLAQVAQDCKEETAILYRDNDSALPLIDLLERQGIPYRCRQVDSGFFTHRVVRDIVDILTLAQDPWDGDAFLRVYYKLGAGISRAAAEQAAAQCGPDTSPILELVASLPGTSPWTRRQCKALQTHMANLLTQRADRGVYRIVHFMGYGDYLEQRGMDQSKTQILEALGANEPTPGGLLERLEVLRELVRAGSSQNDCPFILSTIHSSKGLEYKRVILMDVADGLLPKTLPGPDASSQDLDAYEEERRLFYVGMTRAKEELWVMRFRRSELTSRFASSLFPKSKEEAKKAVSLSPRAVPDLVAIEQTSRRCVPGAALCHRSFGPGQVVSRSGDIILVRFADGVERRFSLSAALRLGQFQLAEEKQ